MGGRVILAGAGIGSSKNVTLAVREALDKADVLVFDRLLNQDLVAPYLGKKEVYYVGKKAGDHTLPQDEINQLLVDRAREGKLVVRLKGGDPYIFGRGSEEALFLVEKGVDFEVLPGLTSGSLALATAGIPPTHRDLVTSVSFITGHRKKGVVGSFKEYAQLEGTLVFYMGVKNLPIIIKDLLAGGIDPKKPAAMIEHGGYPDQRTLVSTVENIVEDAKEADIQTPAVTVIGDTIPLREDLNFFENRPLFGTSVLVTRARSQSRGLAEMLEAQGALVHEVPTITIQPANQDLLKKKLQETSYDYIIFMSANAVEIFFETFLEDHDIRDLHGVKFAVVGKKTKEVLETYHIRADLMPDRYVGEDLVEALEGQVKKSDRVLLPHSNISRKKIVDGIKALGQVDEVILYENHPPQDPVPLPDEKDYVLFTSSSTVNNFLDIYGKEALRETKILSIGPVTTETIRANGLKVSRESDEATIASLVDALKEEVGHE